MSRFFHTYAAISPFPGDTRRQAISSFPLRPEFACLKAVILRKPGLYLVSLFQNSFIWRYFCQLTKQKEITAKANKANKDGICRFDSRLALQAVLKAAFFES
jgi:hypothetical protein